MFYTSVEQIGNSIFHQGYDDNGHRFEESTDFCPELFIHSKEKTGFKDIYEKNVKKNNLSSIKDYKKFKKSYSDTLEILGDIGLPYQWISNNYKNEIDYNYDHIRIWMYDIESIDRDDMHGNEFPSPENPVIPIVSISIRDTRNKQYYVFCLNDFDYKKSKIILDDISKVNVFCYTSEEKMLKDFIRLVEQYRPDVLIGYFSKLFDNPYIISRINHLLGDYYIKKLSPIGSVTFEERDYNGEKEYKISIKGIQILDYIELYKNFIPMGRESFSLDYISKFELGEDIGKIDYDEYENIKQFYLKDPFKFIEYNIYDVELIHLLDKKLRLIPLLINIAYMAKINYEDVLSPIRTWDALIYNYLKEKNIVIPKNSKESKGEYPGAYVHEPIAGIYDWVVSFDLTSLYPHLIMQYNISPETLVNDELDVSRNEIDKRFLNKEQFGQNPDYIISGAGYYFRKDVKGFFPILMEELFNKRKAAKNEMLNFEKLSEKENTDKYNHKISALNNQQRVIKVLLNSLYGAAGNQYFRYYDLKLASSITLSGQLSIIWIMNCLNKKFGKYTDNFVTYCDTDSVYLNLKFIGDKLKISDYQKKVDAIDKFAEEYIRPVIDDGFNELKEYMNCNENRMFMKRENICEKFLITKKKRYAYLVWDSEGVRFSEAKFKVKGLEIVRSSTPAAVKPFIKQTIINLMNDPENINQYFFTIKDEFMKLSPEEIAFPRSVDKMKQYSSSGKTFYKKGTPIGVRAALIFNKYIKDNGIPVEEISDGNKIKFLYTLQPNCFYNENVFGYLGKIPHREEIIKYVDYATQFNKTVKSICINISEQVGYPINTKNEVDLDSLF